MIEEERVGQVYTKHMNYNSLKTTNLNNWKVPTISKHQETEILLLLLLIFASRTEKLELPN